MAKRMNTQREIEFPGTLDATTADMYQEHGRELLALIALVCQQSGSKQGAEIALEAGADPTHFSQALNGNGKAFSVKWLPRVLKADREHRILRFLSDLVGMDLRPRRIGKPRATLRVLAEAILDEGEVGIAMVRKRLGPRFADILESAANDEGEDEP